MVLYRDSKEVREIRHRAMLGLISEEEEKSFVRAQKLREFLKNIQDEPYEYWGFGD